MTRDVPADVAVAIGSGRWTPADGADLRRLVRADRLLRLVTLSKIVREEGAVVDGDPFDLAWRALRALPTHELHEVVATPAAGAWIATAEALVGRDAHRRLPGGHAAAHLGRLAELVLPWLDRFPDTTELRFQLRSEPILFLDRAGTVALRLPIALAGAEIRAQAGDPYPSLSLLDGTDAAGKGGLLRAPVIGGIVVDALAPERDLGAPDRHFTDHDHPAAAAIVDLLPRALALLDVAGPNHADVRDVVTRVFPMATDGRAVLNHTAKAMFGALATTPPATPAAMAEVLVHETQHSKLHAAELAVAFVRDGDVARHYSPWRDDPRPASALLHGGLSFVAVAELWSTIDGGGAEAVRRARQVLVACDGLEAAPLTATGEHLTGALRDRALDVLESVGPLPGATMADIARSIARHRAAWQERGAPIPVASDATDPPPVEDHHVAAALGASGGIPRNPLDRRQIRADPTAGALGRLSVTDPASCASMLRALEDDPPADPLTRAVLAGHAAYVSRDFDGALVSYEAAVAKDPTNVDRWADLAFCLRHLGRTDEAATVLKDLDRLARPTADPRPVVAVQMAAAT